MIRKVVAWSVHLFTACGAVCGLLAIQELIQEKYTAALLWMGAAIIIDALDGSLARVARVKTYAPEIDGELLDNIIDFVNYVLVPAVFLLLVPLVPAMMQLFTAILIILASAYQFSHQQAKTADHFFRGFPSYWNIVVCYLFLWQSSVWANFFVIIALALLSLIPVKYLYPSRLEYFSHNPLIRGVVFWATVFWGGATLALIYLYPAGSLWLNLIIISYMALYLSLSVLRTLRPLTT